MILYDAQGKLIDTGGDDTFYEDEKEVSRMFRAIIDSFRSRQGVYPTLMICHPEFKEKLMVYLDESLPPGQPNPRAASVFMGTRIVADEKLEVDAVRCTRGEQ